MLSLQQETHVKLRRATWRLNHHTSSQTSLLLTVRLFLHQALWVPRKDCALHTPVAGAHKKVWLFFSFPERSIGQRIYTWSKMNDAWETLSREAPHHSSPARLFVNWTELYYSTTRQFQSGSHDLQLASQKVIWRIPWLLDLRKEKKKKSHTRKIIIEFLGNWVLNWKEMRSDIVISIWWI